MLWQDAHGFRKNIFGKLVRKTSEEEYMDKFFSICAKDVKILLIHVDVQNVISTE